MITKGMTVQEKKDTIVKIWDDVYSQESIIEDCKNMMKDIEQKIIDTSEYMDIHSMDQEIVDNCKSEIFDFEIQIGDWYHKMTEPKKEKARCLRDIKQLAKQIPIQGVKF